VSNTTEVINLYLYDTEVSDELFRRLVLDAIERDIEAEHGIANALHSVKV
jgi:hypothetical protein